MMPRLPALVGAVAVLAAAPAHAVPGLAVAERVQWSGADCLTLQVPGWRRAAPSVPLVNQNACGGVYTATYPVRSGQVSGVRMTAVGVGITGFCQVRSGDTSIYLYDQLPIGGGNCLGRAG